LVRAVLPQLRVQGGGWILQLASLGGYVAYPGLTRYNASKFTMVGFIVPSVTRSHRSSV
jgi:short-subunit dehydrogenase